MEQQHKLNVCENNWVQRIAGADTWKEDEQPEGRDWDAVQLNGKSSKKPDVWEGQLVQMEKDRLSKRAEAMKQPDRKKRGRLRKGGCKKGSGW